MPNKIVSRTVVFCTVLTSFLMLTSCGEKPGPAIHDGEIIREANGTVGNTADGKFDETTKVAVKTPKTWNGSYYSQIDENQFQYRYEYVTALDFSSKLVIAYLTIDSLRKENDKLTIRLKKCEGDLGSGLEHDKEKSHKAIENMVLKKQ